MKKLIFVLFIHLIVLLSACSPKNKMISEAKSSNSSQQAEKTLEKATENSSALQSSENTTTVSSSNITTVPTTTASERAVGTTITTRTIPQPSTPTKKSVDTSTSTATSTTTVEKTTKPSQVFDAQPYLDYAIAYGKSIGLIYESQIGKGAWNAPMNLYASLSEENMKLGIRSSCDVLLREGFEYFYPFIEKQANDKYLLFVYYG